MVERIFALDPGPLETGFVRLEGNTVTHSGVVPNEAMRRALLLHTRQADLCAIEMIASYGMAVGAEVFDTCTWIGRFEEAWVTATGGDLPVRIFRFQVKMALCKDPRAKDSNVRQAILDLYGGKATAIGNKKAPGPLYGVKSHAWSALAVALTAREVMQAQRNR